MFGNEGRSPNVGNFEASPLTPLEHATPFIEPPELSNVVSYVARRGKGGCTLCFDGGAEYGHSPGVRGSWPGSGKARAACTKKSAKAKIAGESIELYKSLELGYVFLMNTDILLYASV